VANPSRFVQTFANSIEQHPLLVYPTALPFTPVNTPIFRTFYTPDQHIPCHYSNFSTATRRVTSVVFSNNGTRLISSSADKSIRVWDTSSGAEPTAPFLGHTAEITSIAVSPNGQKIVSGSFDATIRLWNMDSGTGVLPPLRGHTNTVTSVTFSPDGTQIGSASLDITVRVWYAILGHEIRAGHERSVTSVVYSPDGRRILSGSKDRTIRVWDPTLRIEILKPFRGHTDTILSVVISSNGEYVASGSIDGSIRTWHAQTGFKGPTLQAQGADRAQSIIFFPDGKCLR
jgi:WD40 repeat protein